MAKSPQQVADKWARRIAGSTQDIIDGVNAVRTNPAEAAIAKKSKLLQNFTASVQDGRWERGLRRMSLDQWKQSMIQKGVNRVAQGADAAKPKMAQFMTEFLPFQESAQAELSALPDTTIEDSIARAAFWMRRMNSFTRSG